MSEYFVCQGTSSRLLIALTTSPRVTGREGQRLVFNEIIEKMFVLSVQAVDVRIGLANLKRRERPGNAADIADVKVRKQSGYSSEIFPDS